MNNLIDLILSSNKPILLIGLLLIVFALIITLTLMIYKKIQFGQIFSNSKQMFKIAFNRLDDKAKSNLMSRLQLITDQSDYRIKLSFFESLDLKLIERSNIRSKLPFLNIYVLVIFIAGIFIFAFFPILSVFESFKTSLLLSAFVSLIPLILLDTMSSFNATKARKMTANFLSLLHSWLEVKNDLIFALQNVVDDIDVPMKFYLVDALAQLKSGVDPDYVFDILSYKVNTEQFYTIAKNFKSVLKNGGNLVSLVSVLEEEAYMVDNEFETRIVDTFSTRLLLHVLLLGSFGFLVGSLLLSPDLRELYMHTDGGKDVLFFAFSVFVVGFLWNLKSSAIDY